MWTCEAHVSPRIRLFVTKTDVRNVSCCDLLESLFCHVGNPLGPLLLTIFVHCSLCLIFVKAWDAHLFRSTSELASRARLVQKGGQTPCRSRQSTTHWEAESQAKNSCNQDSLHQPSPPFCLHPGEPRVCWKIQA